jgi:hypothetical protein
MESNITLYIGLAKDQRIGIWILPWDAGVGSGRVNLCFT